MFGAAIGGVTGTIDAAVNSGVFPSNYDVPLLITIYAMLILGGVGSLPGAVAGRHRRERLARGAARREPVALALLRGRARHARRQGAAVASAGAVVAAPRRPRLRDPRDRRRGVARGYARRGRRRRRGRARGAELGDPPAALGDPDRELRVRRARAGGARADARARALAHRRCSCRRSTSPPSSGRTGSPSSPPRRASCCSARCSSC